MNVRKKIALIAVVLVTSSCVSREKPLTADECRFVTEKEATALANQFNKFPGMANTLLAMADERAAQCQEAGEFDREDFRCVTAARNDESIIRCLKAAEKKHRG